jgi:hypothetical protein
LEVKISFLNHEKSFEYFDNAINHL